jgi:hypothetical protein
MIWANPPTVGNYDVFVDVNANGIFDYESDAVIGEGSVGFSVIRECESNRGQRHISCTSLTPFSLSLLQGEGRGGDGVA